VNDVDRDGIRDWRSPVGTATGSFATGDYDPEKPGTRLYNNEKTVLRTGGAAARDVYRWPARTTADGIVEARAKFEIEAAEASVSLYHGTSQFAALVPGGKFTLANVPPGPDDGTYALRSVRHVIEDTTWISADGSASYENGFEAFKIAVPWRQSLITPRPRMEGVHSALVMGPRSDEATDIKMQSGEEIYTDDLARVKVRFYWDWRAEATGAASIWARVIQPWAGNGWGMQFTPRVGTEVAVAFVDGDPDRPIVIGGLYNGVSAPIYPVAEKTKTGIRTRSSLSGDTSHFNELTFDDKSGSELIFIHAEKDMTTEVEHDESLTVDNCRGVLVKADETITVQGKQTVTVTKDQTLEVSQGNHGMTVDQGNHTTKVLLGAITMEAMQSITLKVGQNTMTIDQTGITIKGTMVSVQGQVQAELTSLMTKVGGDAMLTLKGGLTMIN